MLSVVSTDRTAADASVGMQLYSLVACVSAAVYMGMPDPFKSQLDPHAMGIAAPHAVP